jgi:hypothetical protein
MAESDLDCDGYPITHLAAVSTTPQRSIVHATGTDDAFSAFYNTGLYAAQTPLSVNTPALLPSGDANSYGLVVTNETLTSANTAFTEYTITNGSVKTQSSTLMKSLASATDTDGSWQVAYTTDGYLLDIHQWYNMGYTGWEQEQYIARPSGTSFQFSPSVCYGNVVFATAGNRLWRLTETATWVKMSDVPVASGPDCHGNWAVAVTTATGSILYAYHSQGSTGPAAEAVVDLGVY